MRLEICAHHLWFLMTAALLASSCGVQSTGRDTGGAENLNGAAGAGGAGPTEDCPAGVSVVLTDYLSTQIALCDWQGRTQSASLISTASAETDGLAFALSGDVVLPSAPQASGQVVLLDRFGTNVITWVDPGTGEVLAQLPVGTGFESNPQDYLEVSEELALVSRWGQNGNPGRQRHDAGGDLLRIDLSRHAILGNLVLPAPDELPARPGALSRVGEELLVTLDRIALDFSRTGEAMLVGVDLEGREVLWQHTLQGRKACGRATLSPDGERLVVACTGALNPAGDIESLSQSALVVFDANERPLRELATFEAHELLGIAIQSGVQFVTDELVLLKTQTPWGGRGNNQLFALDLETGETQTLLEARADAEGKGKGLVYGGMACAPGCSDTCLMADADQAVLQRVLLNSDGTLEVLEPRTLENQVGLPPVDLSGR